MPFNPDVTPNSLYHPDRPHEPAYVNTKKRYDELCNLGYMDFRDLPNKPQYPKKIGYSVATGKAIFVADLAAEKKLIEGVDYTKEKPIAMNVDPEAEKQAMRDEIDELKARMNQLLESMESKKSKKSKDAA